MKFFLNSFFPFPLSSLYHLPTLSFVLLIFIAPSRYQLSNRTFTADELLWCFHGEFY